MNTLFSIKEMVNMLKEERLRLNKISGLLNGKTTVGGDLIYSIASKAEIEIAYNRVSDAIEILVCEYLKSNEPEFFARLNSKPELEVYFEEGVGTEHMHVYGVDTCGKTIDIVC